MNPAPTQGESQPLDLDPIRQKLGSVQGKAYWDTLEEVSQESAFQGFLAREFPMQRPEWAGDAPTRRAFLQVMAGSLAAAGLGACTKQPVEKIVPFSAQPESRVPGRPQYFATGMPFGGETVGLVVESHGGRPTKIDGNSKHPAGSSATDAFAQAEILELYDPDRTRSPLRAGRPSNWAKFGDELGQRMAGMDSSGGGGLAFLFHEVPSPSVQRQIDGLRERYPKATFHRWQAVNRDRAAAGSRIAFGGDFAAQYDVSKASVLLSLDADFLCSGAGHLANARAFAGGRKIRKGSSSMNRLYAVESVPSLTGAMADHRFAVKPSNVENFARALGQKLGVSGANSGGSTGIDARVMDAVADDLLANSGASLVVAGESMSPGVHALVHAINEKLGNAGKTVSYRPAEELAGGESQARSLGALVDEMAAGRVQTLVMVGGNPAFDAPGDFDFAAALREVEFRAHLSLRENETSRLCHWHLPASHFLEYWGDGRAQDGTLTLIQPLIAPLYESRSTIEFLNIVAGDGGKTGYAVVQETTKAALKKTNPSDEAFERAWTRSLCDGFVEGTAFTTEALSVVADADFGGPAPDGGFELSLRPDSNCYDGRYANNGWLQELPRSLTLLSWGNAALISPKTAEDRDLSRGDVVAITADGTTVEAPIWVMLGHPDAAVTLHFGNGRRAAGRVGNGVGHDAYPLRVSEQAWTRSGVELKATGAYEEVVTVQEQSTTVDRDIVREAIFDAGDLDDRLKHAKAVKSTDDGHGDHGDHGDHDYDKLSIYEKRDDGGEYQWGMVIDMNTCLGCNACVVSCQAENNVPVVGRDQVSKGRELHWLRIDRYYVGDLENPAVRFQPVACQHCEQAPCELVCPVGATTHSPEGINEMTYNRCVGTRYCSNNCPYKVRRFNFFRYADFTSDLLKLGRNPDVSVRHRGVMEKCTYCVQRVNQARITSKVEGRRIRDGEIKVACQTVCPTDSITFGDVSDPSSAVSKLKLEPHDYNLLDEMGTAPRTSYLAKLTNPNPAVLSADAS